MMIEEQEYDSADYKHQWHVQAEYGVLAVLLMNNDHYDRVATFLRPEHFSTNIGKKVFAAIGKAISKGERCDVITVYQDLERSDPDNQISILDLNEIAQHGAAQSLLMQYAESVFEKGKERELLAALNVAYQEATDQRFSVAERVAKICSLLDSVGAGDSADKGPVLIGDLIPAYLDRLQNYSEDDQVNAIPTGILKLDEYLGGGWKNGKVYVIAARPSVGKSAIAQSAVEVCARNGKTSAIFSQEMMNDEMVERAVSRVGGVHMGFHGRPNKYSSEQFSYAIDAAGVIANFPCYVYDKAGLRLSDIAARARVLKRKHGLALLAIDYLQLCQSANPKLSRHHQIEEISRGIKVLAKELDIPILLLSQLSRKVEDRTPPRPMASDLKESGAIEEDADAIILMWPHEVGEESTLVGFDIAKNRGGSKGSFGVRFVGKYQQWHETDEPLREVKKFGKKVDDDYGI